MELAPSKIAPRALASWIIFALGVFLIFKLQFAANTLWEADGYLHARMAQILQTDGLPRQFHWAKFSYFNEHFSDKDFLYHALLIPFTLGQDIFYGSKIAAALFASLLLYAFFWPRIF